MDGKDVIMTESICLKDSYAKECESTVLTVKDGKYVVLDKTVFYARGGGQPTDTGKIIVLSSEVSGLAGKEFRVLNVTKSEGQIIHEMDQDAQNAGLKTGDRVKCIIDWDRRYRLMRIHTATHVLAAIMNKEEGVLISGNELGEQQSRIDFNLENPTREKIESYIAKTNEALKRNMEVKTYFLPREEALKLEGAVKLMGALPPEIKELRIVEIGDVDRQADGGTHVHNTSEVGEIELIKIDNKGKSNRRIYFRLK